MQDDGGLIIAFIKNKIKKKKGVFFSISSTVNFTHNLIINSSALDDGG